MLGGKLGRFAMTIALGVIPVLCGCSPEAPVRDDPAPNASIVSLAE